MAENVAQRQLRAYLLPDSSLIPRVDLSVLEIKIKNFGQTPAYNVTTWWDAKVVGAKDVENDELFRFQETTRASVDTGPNGILPLGKEIDETVIFELNGGKVFVAWGSVKYRDTFGRCQFTTFRLRTEKKMGHDGWRLIGAGRGNSASDPASEQDTGGPYKKAIYPREGEIWRKD